MQERGDDGPIPISRSTARTACELHEAESNCEAAATWDRACNGGHLGRHESAGYTCCGIGLHFGGPANERYERNPGLGVDISELDLRLPLIQLTFSQSFLSITYLIFHTTAAIHNEPVGVVRPPELKLHAACFIVARLALICWFATFIAASVTLSKPKVCVEGTRNCRLQVADVVASIVAL